MDILKGFSTLSATVLALTFVFGNSVRQTYESMLFLFVVRDGTHECMVCPSPPPPRPERAHAHVRRRMFCISLTRVIPLLVAANIAAYARRGLPPPPPPAAPAGAPL